MNKAVRTNKDDRGPAVLRFTARLIRQTDAPKTGSGILIEFPKPVSRKLRGMNKIEGTMNGQPFRAALETNSSGRHSVRVNKAMLKGARAVAGDTVNLAILGPESKLVVPADLRVAISASEEAEALWDDLTPEARRDWVRWIVSAKTPETRARRIARTIDQLSEGKRRPCCVNVYEFMLSRVQ